jgi:hypothetical protein
MDMEHGHAEWTYGTLCTVHAEWTWSKDMQRGHAARTCSVDMQRGHAAWTGSMDMEHRYEAWKCNMDGHTVHLAYGVAWISIKDK